jgi:hypothetical protein
VAHVGVPANGPLRLYRGLRHQDADAIRAALANAGTATTAALRLPSYSLSEGAALGFARKRITSAARGTQSTGLVYRLDVAMSDFVFVENAQLCEQLLIEEEVLVLHGGAVQITRAEIVDDAVPVARF